MPPHVEDALTAEGIPAAPKEVAVFSWTTADLFVERTKVEEIYCGEKRVEDFDELIDECERISVSSLSKQA